jgi:hypothetical protein
VLRYGEMEQRVMVMLQYMYMALQKHPVYLEAHYLQRGTRVECSTPLQMQILNFAL